MAKVIEELFKRCDDIKYLMKDDEYFRCWRIKNEAQEKLFSDLTPEMKLVFKDFLMADNYLRYLEHKEQFVKGFRQGANYTYEAFFNKRCSN